MRARLLARALILLIAFSCSEQSSDPREPHEVSRAASPAGWCVASIVEFDHGPDNQNTQVLLSFDDDRCGAGAVATDGLNAGLELRWLDDTTLEVRHPKGSTPRRNPSGEIIQCLDRKVRVVLASR